MAKNKRESKVEEVEHLTATESFIDKYKQPLIYGGIGIVVVVLGIIGYQKLIAEPHEQESIEAYWPAFREFEQDSFNLAVSGTPEFDGMIDIADEYSGTSGGNIANYSLAIAAMENGEFEAALDYFDECDFDDIIVGSMVLGLKGDCYVELGDYETAIDYFEEAANRQPNEYTSPMYLKKAGIAYEAIGDGSSALKVYKEIKQDWSDSEEALDIDKYIARAAN